MCSRCYRCYRPLLALLLPSSAIHASIQCQRPNPETESGNGIPLDLGHLLRWVCIWQATSHPIPIGLGASRFLPLANLFHPQRIRFSGGTSFRQWRFAYSYMLASELSAAPPCLLASKFGTCTFLCSCHLVPGERSCTSVLTFLSVLPARTRLAV